MPADFGLDISQWAEKQKANLDEIVRKVAIDAFTRVIMRSPVDTGRFRGNWQVAIGQMPDGVLDLEDKSGTATVSKATAAAMQAKAGDHIFLVNNLPYAVALEYGHSGQAPAGMVRVTVQEFKQMLGQAVKGTK